MPNFQREMFSILYHQVIPGMDDERPSRNNTNNLHNVGRMQLSENNINQHQKTVVGVTCIAKVLSNHLLTTQSYIASLCPKMC